jgi:hypothetical protein
LLFRAGRPPEGSGRLVTSGPTDDGRAGRDHRGRVKAGEVVALVEPRHGRDRPESPDSGTRGVLRRGREEAFLALHLARPLLGQRVFDVLQALRALESGRTASTSSGRPGGPIALHAAALDDRIKSVEIERSPVSWTAVAAAPVSRDQLSGVVPGGLESYDLPDLAALLAPRPLTIRSATEPDGTPTAQALVEAAYAPATTAYRERQASEHLVFDFDGAR